MADRRADIDSDDSDVEHSAAAAGGGAGAAPAAADAGGGADDGISRCSISGLYDMRGNPAALASGWLAQLEDGGRKKHRYFVLGPTFLAYFAAEEHARISAEGFMLGVADAAGIAAGSTQGVSFSLARIASLRVDSAASTFTISLSSAVEGLSALVLECANGDIAKGWSDAIAMQKDRHTTIAVPPRSADGAARGPVASLTGRLGGSFRGSGSGGEACGHSAWWGDRGIDMMARENESRLRDAGGHPAALLCGFMEKKNKTGLRAGLVWKQRYFVLLPDALCFFPDEHSADVRAGYMWGTAVGEKIGGLFQKTGGRLPLESVCDVRLLTAEGAAPRAGEETEAAAGSTLVEIDFGAYTLVVNAYSLRNRDAWVAAIRKWSAWKKKKVDEAMFAGMGKL